MGRKEAILEAAVDLFAERGFHATPTSAVAKKAGVAEGLIFHYFKSKEGIFVHILEEMSGRYVKGIECAAEESVTGLEGIARIISFHFRFSRENTKPFLIIIRDFPYSPGQPDSAAEKVVVNRSARVSDAIRTCIEKGKKDGSIRKVSTEETILIIRGLLTGTCRLTLLGGPGPPNLVEEVTDFCLHGLAAGGESVVNG